MRSEIVQANGHDGNVDAIFFEARKSNQDYADFERKQVCSVMAEKLRCAGTPEAISVAIAGPCDTQLDEHAPPLRSRLRPRRTWRMVSASPNIAV